MNRGADGHVRGLPDSRSPCARVFPKLADANIRVASYWTEVLPKKELERKLHDAVRLARARLERQEAWKRTD